MSITYDKKVETQETVRYKVEDGVSFQEAYAIISNGKVAYLSASFSSHSDGENRLQFKHDILMHLEEVAKLATKMIEGIKNAETYEED